MFQKLPGIMADISSKEIQRMAAKYFGEKKAFIVRVIGKGKETARQERDNQKEESKYAEEFHITGHLRMCRRQF